MPTSEFRQFAPLGGIMLRRGVDIFVFTFIAIGVFLLGLIALPIGLLLPVAIKCKDLAHNFIGKGGGSHNLKDTCEMIKHPSRIRNQS
jgi:hypothetical protein